jgi:hypothetical protein
MVSGPVPLAPLVDEELRDFLERAVIEPVLESPRCSSQLRTAYRRLRARFQALDRRGQLWFYWKCMKASHWRQMLVEEELQQRGLPSLLTVADEVARHYGQPPDHLFTAAFD